MLWCIVNTTFNRRDVILTKKSLSENFCVNIVALFQQMEIFSENCIVSAVFCNRLQNP